MVLLKYLLPNRDILQFPSVPFSKNIQHFILTLTKTLLDAPLFLKEKN